MLLVVSMARFRKQPKFDLCRIAAGPRRSPDDLAENLALIPRTLAYTPRVVLRKYDRDWHPENVESLRWLQRLRVAAISICAPLFLVARMGSRKARRC